MPLFTKPQFNNVWASTGAKLTPEVAKISQGWVVEIPPHEFDNWMQNRQDALLAHLNQLGVPQWDSTVEYQAGKSYVQGTTKGVVYKALTTHTNVDPEIDIQNNWMVAFESSGSALLKVNNLSDVPDKAQARINLGIATTEFYDTRYLQRSSNLSDVPNKSTARQQLDVYGKSEVFSKTEIEALLPAGVIEYHASSEPIAGRLLAAGQAVSRVTYSKLFSRIGTTFGAGNGSTTFNLPDGRATFPRGLDLGRGLDGGRVLGSLQLSQNQAHTHAGSTNNGGVHTHAGLAEVGFDVEGSSAGGSTLRFGMGDNYPYNGVVRGMADGSNHTHTLVIDNSGGSESRPVNTAWACFITTGLAT